MSFSVSTPIVNVLPSTFSISDLDFIVKVPL